MEETEGRVREGDFILILFYIFALFCGSFFQIYGNNGSSSWFDNWVGSCVQAATQPDP